MSVEEDSTILEAAKLINIKIPTLCFMKNCNKVALCRICVVEVKGMRNFMPACATKVREGMEIVTDSEALMDARRRSMDLIFKHHNTKCEYCSRYSDCELHEVLRLLGMNEHPYETGQRSTLEIIGDAIVRDNTKCITCRRCVSTCSKIQGMNVLKVFRSAEQTYIGVEPEATELSCTLCGACVMACPTGALSEKNIVNEVSFVLRNKCGKRVVAVVSEDAAKRVGEGFYDFDKNLSDKKIVTALNLIGFDKVYKKEDYVASVYCPSVRRMAEQKFPEIAKNLYKEDEANVYTKIRQEVGDAYIVSITPCISEKGEKNDADYIMTTRECINLFQHQCVSRFTANEMWKEMEPGVYDCLKIGNKCENMQDKISVFGLKNVEEILSEIQEGKVDKGSYNFYACPKGCMYGGGQPRREK